VPHHRVRSSLLGGLTSRKVRYQQKELLPDDLCWIYESTLASKYQMPHFFDPADGRLSPEPLKAQGSQLSFFIDYFAVKAGYEFSNYTQFQQIAIRDFRLFWHTFLDWSQIIAEGRPEPVW